MKGTFKTFPSSFQKYIFLFLTFSLKTHFIHRYFCISCVNFKRIFKHLFKIKSGEFKALTSRTGKCHNNITIKTKIHSSYCCSRNSICLMSLFALVTIVAKILRHFWGYQNPFSRIYILMGVNENNLLGRVVASPTFQRKGTFVLSIPPYALCQKPKENYILQKLYQVS